MAMVAATRMPITAKTPTIPFASIGRVIDRLSSISSPPYRPIRLRIRPPATTEAIWPETLTLMEYISRKF